MEYLPETEEQFIDRVFTHMKGRRQDLRMTQDALGRRINRTQNYVSVRERGTQEMDLADALLIAAALGMALMGKMEKPVRKVERTVTQAIKDRQPVSKPPVTPSGPQETGPVKTEQTKPSPAQMPKKAEPAPVRVAGVARVPQAVNNRPPDPKVRMPTTFMWKDDLRVNPGANEAAIGILAVDGDLEATLELPIQDARRLKSLLAVKLPHRDTQASSYVTTMLDRVNRAMSESMAQNRRTKVMRLIQPEVMAVMTDVWSEIRDVRTGAETVEKELLKEQQRLQGEIERLGGRAAATAEVVDAEEKGAETVKRQMEENERLGKLNRDLEWLKSEKQTLESKLQRLRKEMEDQDTLVGVLKKQLEEQQNSPSDDKKARDEAEESLDVALTILDELWELAGAMRESGSADNKMTGMTLQMKMKEMGYDDE